MENATKQKRSRRSIAPAVALAAVALAGAACGSGHESGTSAMLKQADSVAFAKCVRENGVPDFKDPAPGVGMGEGIDLNSPTFKKAVEACEDVMPTPFLRNNTDENWSTADKRTYAACMRSNGVPSFPDPDRSGAFKLDDNDPNTPRFKKAEQACKQHQPQNIPSMTPSKTGGS